jgi:hypothetical protein
MLGMARRSTVAQIMTKARNINHKALRGLSLHYQHPDYSWQQKLLRLANDERLTKRKLWPRLPDSVEALLQLSYLDNDQFDEAMQEKDGHGNYLINKKTELATVKALRKSIEEGEELDLSITGPPVFLFCQTRNVGNWLKRAQYLFYENKRKSTYQNVFNGTAFYLTRPLAAQPVLHDLTDKQAQLILGKLKDANITLDAVTVGKNFTVSEEPGKYIDFHFSKETSKNGVVIHEHGRTYRKFITPEHAETVLYYADGSPVKGVEVGYYKPSRRQANHLGSLPLWEMTDVLPDAIVRYAERRRFFPKPAAEEPFRYTTSASA